MKLSEAVEQYELINTGILTKGALTNNLLAFSDLAEYLCEDLQVSDIGRDDIRGFRSWLLTRPRKTAGRRYAATEAVKEIQQRRAAGKLSLHTVHGRMRSIKRLFNFLVEEGIIPEGQSPILGVRNVSLPAPAPKAIEIKNAQKMLEVARRPSLQRLYMARDAAIASLMMSEADDGLTVGSGELSRLEIGHIRWDVLNLVKIENIPQRLETDFSYQMKPEQQQAFYDWLAIRPLFDDSPHVFTTLDPRGREGDGGQMTSRAVYSAYHTWNQRTPADWETYNQRLEHDEYYQARRLAMLYFMADTGARRGGILGLTHDRLDLARREAVVIEKGRGGGSPRPVFFSQATAAALAAWLEISAGDFGESVFGMREKKYRDMVDGLAKQAGIDAIHNPHSWRHGFARLVLMGGSDLATVSQLMGHATVKTTGDYYARFNTRELKAAHNKYSPLDWLLEPGTGSFDYDEEE